ncbi:MAG: hypothetical protein AB7V77_04025 [Candidatus Woesearchaeota archaeon]
MGLSDWFEKTFSGSQDFDIRGNQLIMIHKDNFLNEENIIKKNIEIIKNLIEKIKHFFSEKYVEETHKLNILKKEEEILLKEINELKNSKSGIFRELYEHEKHIPEFIAKINNETLVIERDFQQIDSKLNVISGMEYLKKIGVTEKMITDSSKSRFFELFVSEITNIIQHIKYKDNFKYVLTHHLFDLIELIEKRIFNVMEICDLTLVLSNRILHSEIKEDSRKKQVDQILKWVFPVRLKENTNLIKIGLKKCYEIKTNHKVYNFFNMVLPWYYDFLSENKNRNREFDLEFLIDLLNKLDIEKYFNVIKLKVMNNEKTMNLIKVLMSNLNEKQFLNLFLIYKNITERILFLFEKEKISNIEANQILIRLGKFKNSLLGKEVNLLKNYFNEILNQEDGTEIKKYISSLAIKELILKSNNKKELIKNYEEIKEKLKNKEIYENEIHKIVA